MACAAGSHATKGGAEVGMAAPNNEELMAMALKAAEGAYCPYSNFRVGAAIRTSDGTVYTGCNVENASYGLAICAERTALVKMVSAGHKEIDTIAVACIDLPDDAISSPCGACRQFMAEFGQFSVLMHHTGGKVTASTVDDLLPYAFRPDSFKK